VTDLSVCQMELPCNSGPESRRSASELRFRVNHTVPPPHTRLTFF